MFEQIDKREQDKLRQQKHRRKMAELKVQLGEVHTVIKDIKRSFKRGMPTAAIATQMLEDFPHVFSSMTLEEEVEKLPRDIIPNAPMDEIEAIYETLSKSEREAEYQKLSDKMRFLETLDQNEDIRGNLFIREVVLEVDAKIKQRTAEKAGQKARQALGFVKSNFAPTEPTTAKAAGGGGGAKEAELGGPDEQPESLKRSLWSSLWASSSTTNNSGDHPLKRSYSF